MHGYQRPLAGLHARLSLALQIALLVVLGATIALGDVRVAGAGESPKAPVKGLKIPMAASRIQQMAVRHEKLSITGVRLTWGDAVRCAKVQADDGETYSVSSLGSGVAIGDRVRISGFMAYVTSCTGPVLYAEEIVPLDN